MFHTIKRANGTTLTVNLDWVSHISVTKCTHPARDWEENKAVFIGYKSDPNMHGEHFDASNEEIAGLIAAVEDIGKPCWGMTWDGGGAIE